MMNGMRRIKVKKKKTITPQPKATPKHAPTGCMSLLV